MHAWTEILAQSSVQAFQKKKTNPSESFVFNREHISKENSVEDVSEPEQSLSIKIWSFSVAC